MAAKAATSNGTLTLSFELERETKGAIRFQEVVDTTNPLAEAKVGTVYVRKATLAALGYKPGDTLDVTFEVVA